MIFKTRMCRFIQQDGYCNKGENCRFAHSTDELRTNPNEKTRICQHWLRGNCRFGDFCYHAHGEHELKMPEDNPFYKTTMCRNWMNGSCNAHGCSYAHGDDELREKPTNHPALGN